MVLLIDIRQPTWMQEDALRDVLSPMLRDVPILCGLEDGDLSTVTMAAVSRLHPGMVERLPNLQLVQKLGAGVETIMREKGLAPHVRVTRLISEMPANEVAEYCLTYALAFQRNVFAHDEAMREHLWQKIAPRKTHETTAAILGLGHIGRRAARMFSQAGFRTLGWSRTPKTINGVECRNGDDALASMLGEADIVASILPATPETHDLFDASLLGRMKPGALLINAGRGDLIVEDDLIAALEAGTPGHAVLDVFRTEPLPEGHAFWSHPKVTVTPHVSGWHLDDGLPDVAENYRRLTEGRPLLNEVDRGRGY